MKRIASRAVLAAIIAVSVSLTAQSKADARACLEFTTNVEITRCAEKYF